MNFFHGNLEESHECWLLSPLELQEAVFGIRTTLYGGLQIPFQKSFNSVYEI